MAIGAYACHVHLVPSIHVAGCSHSKSLLTFIFVEGFETIHLGPGSVPIEREFAPDASRGAAAAAAARRARNVAQGDRGLRRLHCGR